MEIEKRGSETERLERFQTLQAGQYWRARERVPSEGIDAGEVLLLESIRWVDDVAHTVVMRAHPLKYGTNGYYEYEEGGETKKTWVNYGEHRFLLDTFLRLFEFEPDAAAIRKAELQAVQGEVEAIKAELDDFKTNPETVALVVERGLRDIAEKEAAKDGPKLPALSPRAQADIARVATGSVANALTGGVSEQKIEMLKAAVGREVAVATIKSNWISEQTKKIGSTIAKMTPFFAEEGAAAQAQFEDMRLYAIKLNKGLASLDLYVGKGVESFAVREGEAAPYGEPLAIVQKKRCIDQELALHADVDEWFDFSRIEKFFDTLRTNDALVRQIFPTQRCIMVMATTQRYIDYGQNDFASAIRNMQNREVMLLVRNGGNIHVVFSPVESHLGANRLFPTRDEGDRIFRGVDGRNIKFEDLAFTDKLSHHESQALHYRRFLILLAGLDHREKLFGDFYDERDAFEFVSPEFQDRYFRFIRDDDNSANLPGQKRQTVQSWIKEMNGYVQPGSRIMANWQALLTLETAPSVFERSSNYRREAERRRLFVPKERFSIAVLSREGTDLVTEVEVRGEGRRLNERSFNAKVNLSKYDEPYGPSELIPYLCLDKVTPEDVRWYMHDRGARTDHITYIRLFKAILAAVEAERAVEAPTRELMAKALRDGKVVAETDIPGVVDSAVAAWRAANRGRPLPKSDGKLPPAQWKAILDLMFHSAVGSDEREAMAIALLEGKGYAPLRFAAGGDGRVAIYAAPLESERDDRIEPFAWVHRIVLDFKDGEAKERTRKWVTLPGADASEKVLREWDTAKNWVDLKSDYASPVAKTTALAAFTPVDARIGPYLSKMSHEAFDRIVAEWDAERARMSKKAKGVVNPDLCLPLGIVVDRYGEKYTAALLVNNPHALFHEIAPDEGAKVRLREAFYSVFGERSRGITRFNEAITRGHKWSLVSMAVDPKAKPHSFITSRDHYGDIRWGRVDPTMDGVFAEWVAKKGDRSAYFAEGLRREDGSFRLDDMLGLGYPEGYGPFHTAFVAAHATKGVEIAYGVWVEASKNKIDNSRPMEWDGKEVGWSSMSNTLATMEDVNEYVAMRALEKELVAKHHSELHDAPRPPEGVDRWYLIKP